MGNMGKVTIEFDTIEEAEEIQDALNGYKWKMIIWDMDQELRKYLKYDETLDAKSYKTVEKLREFLNETINGYGLDSRS
jgi:hypothetical protein